MILDDYYINEIFKTGIGFLGNIFLFNFTVKLVDLSIYKKITDKKIKFKNIFNIYYVLNACILSTYAIYTLYFRDIRTFNIIKYYHLSFLILDIVKMILLEKDFSKYIFIFHHLLFYIGWYNAYLNYFLYSKLLLAEISVITLDLRYICIDNNFGYGDFLGVLTYIFFTIFRLINYSLIYREYYDLFREYLYIYYLPLLFLQYYWFVLMTKKLFKKIVNKL